MKKEVENSIKELEAECLAYEEALEQLSQQSARALPEQVLFSPLHLFRLEGLHRG